MLRYRKMKGFTKTRVSAQTVKLGGKPINLSDMHRETGISISHLSRVISGTRSPSLRISRLIAEYLGISVDVLIKRLEE